MKITFLQAPTEAQGGAGEVAGQVIECSAESGEHWIRRGVARAAERGEKVGKPAATAADDGETAADEGTEGAAV